MEWPGCVAVQVTRSPASEESVPNPRKARAAKGSKADRTGSLGFEETLWKAADLLGSNLDPFEYKHVVQGVRRHSGCQRPVFVVRGDDLLPDSIRA